MFLLKTKARKVVDLMMQHITGIPRNQPVLSVERTMLGFIKIVLKMRYNLLLKKQLTAARLYWRL
jgi:hypothetical protein